MNDAAFVHERRYERRFVTYPLPMGATVVVRPGQGIARGATLAHATAPPLLAPYATDLDLPAPAATALLNLRAGGAVRRGDLLARHRAGFRTITLTAPTDGKLVVSPDAGAAALAPSALVEVVARYGGRVRDVSAGAIVVQSTVERLDCALASPGASGGGTVAVFARKPGREGYPFPSGGAVAVVPHLADIAALRPFERGGVAVVVAGTVSEECAWELLAPHGRAGESVPRTPHVVVVAGPGSAARGGEVVAAVRGWHDRDAWIQRTFGTVALYVEVGGNAPPPGAAARLIELRDATYWGTLAAFAETPAAEPLTRIAVVPDAGLLAVPQRNGIVRTDTVTE